MTPLSLSPTRLIANLQPGLVKTVGCLVMVMMVIVTIDNWHSLAVGALVDGCMTRAVARGDGVSESVPEWRARENIYIEGTTSARSKKHENQKLNEQLNKKRMPSFLRKIVVFLFPGVTHASASHSGNLNACTNTHLGGFIFLQFFSSFRLFVLFCYVFFSLRFVFIGFCFLNLSFVLPKN
jgi:hypothetical protein